MISKRTYFNILKATSILLVLLFIPKACIEFRISDKEALREFEDLPVKPSFGNLMVKNRNMHYAFIDQNKDALAIFIHGSPGSWSAFIDYFKKDSLLSNVDLISIDRPGYGGSDFGNSELSIETQAYLLNQVIKQFDHKNKILIGHSLGGPIIARLAMDYPSDFKGLIFVAPSIDPKLEKKEWYRGILKSRIGRFITPTEFRVSNDEIMTLKDELEKMLPLWNSISVPSLIIQGTDDWLVPKGNADFAKEMLKDSLTTVDMLEGENHFIPWSKNGVITEAIYQMVVPQ